MGGVLIKKIVFKFWVIVVVISSFVLGAVGADLQCADSLIKEFIKNHNTDIHKMSEPDSRHDIQEMFAGFTKGFKKVP